MFVSKMLSKFIKTSTKIIYDNIYGVDITDILMNLVSCQGFSTVKHTISIFPCHIKMVLYYLSKVFSLFNLMEID